MGIQHAEAGKILLDPFCLKQFDPSKLKSQIDCPKDEFLEHINKEFEKNPDQLVDGYFFGHGEETLVQN